MPPIYDYVLDVAYRGPIRKPLVLIELATRMLENVAESVTTAGKIVWKAEGLRFAVPKTAEIPFDASG